ncbi:uncharacterized protein NPIL_79941 [Nephila pilipes]|uniref:Uncharacterized protein n=1 Tax=Nephila pilipes TaxID=299642 RepID=A0A8X6Q7E5_NEPPI|nr:uncharacterized protein NPIL_79941 [Nephila pilipes]
MGFNKCGSDFLFQISFEIARREVVQRFIDFRLKRKMASLRNLLLTLSLFLACWLILPQISNGRHRHRNNGLDTLLTAGVLAKVLQKNGGGHHHHPIFIPIPIPVHHHKEHDHHHHHGSHAMPQFQQLRHPGAMPAAQQPLVGYQAVPMGQSEAYVQHSPFQGTDEVKVIVV